jgi:hypothetical protein
VVIFLTLKEIWRKVFRMQGLEFHHMNSDMFNKQRVCCYVGHVWQQRKQFSPPVLNVVRTKKPITECTYSYMELKNVDSNSRECGIAAIAADIGMWSDEG